MTNSNQEIRTVPGKWILEKRKLLAMPKADAYALKAYLSQLATRHQLV